MTIRNYIENADYYNKNFKGTRDSEFSEYDDVNLSKI